MNGHLLMIGTGLIGIAAYMGFVSGDFATAYKWSLAGSLVMAVAVTWKLK
jgi:hypothetical protein